MQAAASDDDHSVTHSPVADELPPALETLADDNPPPTTRPANTMAPAVPWSTKRVPVLATDAANIQAWLAAVRPIIAFHDASELLTSAVPRTPPGRALARQVLLFLSQTTEASLSSCLVDNDPAASWTALLALRPANAKAIESTAATINKVRLTDTTVGDYTRLHRAAHTALHDMDANHYHAAALTQMHRILRGIDDIPELSAVVLQYSKIDDPNNATVTELFADIQQHAPSHHVALSQADSVCAVCDRAGHNSTNCRTKALLFKNGRINPAAIDALRHLGHDKRRGQRGGGR
jgi:hypothetical protein